MNKKIGKIIGIVLIVIVVIGLICFGIDYNRVQHQEKPIFCIPSLFGEINDGGTMEYYGLGYKVIAFNRTDGYNKIKIGTWGMQYEDLKKEYEVKENVMPMIKSYAETLQELPKDYTQEQAIIDGCFVITNTNTIYNKSRLDEFIQHTQKNATTRIDDRIRIVQYTTEGDMVITQLTYQSTSNTYRLEVDFSRDKFLASSDKKILVNEDIPGTYYGIIAEEKEDSIEIHLALYGVIDNIDSKRYEDILICTYSKNAKMIEHPFFYGTVIQSEHNFIIVEPNEDEEIRKSSDKITISLGEKNDMLYAVGTKIKVTYTGYVQETYPAEIEALDIELKSVENFELIYTLTGGEKSLSKIIDKTKISDYSYDIYLYGGKADIKIEEKVIALQEALQEKKITMDEIIRKANEDFAQKKISTQTYRDGGSILYQYPTYTILKCHTISGNRDVYIGPPEMNMNTVIK